MVKFILGPGVLADTDEICLFNLSANKIQALCSGSSNLLAADFGTAELAEKRFKEIIGSYRSKMSLIPFPGTELTWFVKNKIHTTELEYESGCFKAGTHIVVIHFKQCRRSWLFRFEDRQDAIKELDELNKTIVEGSSDPLAYNRRVDYY